MEQNQIMEQRNIAVGAWVYLRYESKPWRIGLLEQK